MKKLIFIAILTLIGHSYSVFSQRNDNQIQFKTKSSSNYKVTVQDANRSIDQKNVLKGETYQWNYNANDEKNIYDVSKVSQSRQYFAKDNEIYLGVSALMNVKADRFLAVFNITQVGETAAKADELSSARTNSFITG